MSTTQLLLVAVALLACTHACLGHSSPVVLEEDSYDPNQREFTTDELTALQTYVATPDANYEWAHIPQYDMQGDGYKLMWLNMTSLRWLTDADVSKSLWVHWVGVIVPNNLNPAFTSNAFLWIGGGHNSATPPSIWDRDLLLCAALAQETGTVVAAIYAIPNAPIQFWSEKPVPKSRTEDAIIAFAWQHYIEDPSNPEWLPRLPMTKASVRAMDSVTEFMEQTSGATITGWIVAGASKRGWTTWTVGATDPRVIAIVPMVLDELNFVKNIHHHYRAYCGWSFALTDYWSLNFTAQIDSPGVASMMSIVDPIVYANILTMPKLIISTGGDEFLLPDNVDYFWDALQGEKHFHIFPNLEHTMIENVTEVLDTVVGFGLSVLTSTPRPIYDWAVTPNGTIHLEIDLANPPSRVQVWSALTIDGNERRDFRLVAIVNGTGGKPWLHPVFWSGQDIQPSYETSTDLVYDVLLQAPEVGWIGFVVEVEFPGVGNSTIRISTAPSILPQTFPCDECVGEECLGTLV